MPPSSQIELPNYSKLVYKSVIVQCLKQELWRHANSRFSSDQFFYEKQAWSSAGDVSVVILSLSRFKARSTYQFYTEKSSDI